MPLLHDLSEQIGYQIPRFRLHLVKEAASQGDFFRVRSPHDAAQLLAPLRCASEEHFVALHLNAKNEVLGVHEVSHGTLSSSLVHPREVFKAAILANSYAIIACHNHPSGSKLVPSEDDIITTQKLIEASRLMGIPLIDHIILGVDGGAGCEEIFSFREQRPYFWTEEDMNLT
jgi:DNA repair protein RadC